MTRNKMFLKKKIVEHKDIIKNPNEDLPPNRIRIIRIANNMDIEELSTKLGISSSMLQQIETQKKSLSINVLKKISDIFNVSTDYILYMSDNIYDKNDKTDLLTNIEQLKNFYERNNKND